MAVNATDFGLEIDLFYPSAAKKPRPQLTAVNAPEFILVKIIFPSTRQQEISA